MANDILATVAAQRAAARTARASYAAAPSPEAEAAREARIEYADPSKLYQFAGETFTEAEILAMQTPRGAFATGISPLEQLYQISSAELAARDPTTAELLQMAARGISTIQQGLSRIGEAAVLQQQPIEYIIPPSHLGGITSEVATGRIDVPARWREPSPYERSAYVSEPMYGQPAPTGQYIFDPARGVAVPTRELRRGERVLRPSLTPYEQLAGAREDISQSLLGVRERFGLFPKEPRFVTISGQMLGLKEDVVYSPELRTMVSATYPKEIREAWRPPEDVFKAELAGFIGAPYAAASLVVSVPMFLMKPEKETRAGIKAAQRATEFALKEPAWFVGEVGGVLIGAKALGTGARKAGGFIKQEIGGYLEAEYPKWESFSYPSKLTGETVSIQRFRFGGKEHTFSMGEFVQFGDEGVSLGESISAGEMGLDLITDVRGITAKVRKYPRTFGEAIKRIKGEEIIDIDFYMGKSVDFITRDIEFGGRGKALPIPKGAFTLTDKPTIKSFAGVSEETTMTSFTGYTVYPTDISKVVAFTDYSVSPAMLKRLDKTLVTVDIPAEQFIRAPIGKGRRFFVEGAAKDVFKLDTGDAITLTRVKTKISSIEGAGIIDTASLSKPISIAGGMKLKTGLDVGATGAGAGDFIRAGGFGAEFGRFSKYAAATTLGQQPRFVEETLFIHADVANMLKTDQIRLTPTRTRQYDFIGRGVKISTAQTQRQQQKQRQKQRQRQQQQLKAQTQMQTQLQTKLQTRMQTKLQTRLQTQLQTRLQTRLQAKAKLMQAQRIKLDIPVTTPLRMGARRIAVIGRPFARARRGAKPRKGGRRGFVRILADPLSVQITQARLLAAGKRPIALHPVQRIAKREFFRRGGLRVPTTQMLKKRKGRKGKKGRDRRFY